MAQVGDSLARHEGHDGDDDQEQNQVPNQVPKQVPNQVPNPALPPINPFLPNAPIVPGAPPRPQLNLSHFKSKYASKPDKDVEAHILRMNNWMNTHKFLDQVKVQRFC